MISGLKRRSPFMKVMSESQDKPKRDLHGYIWPTYGGNTMHTTKVRNLQPYAISNRGTGYETLELSKARTMLLQSMLN